EFVFVPAPKVNSKATRYTTAPYSKAVTRAAAAAAAPARHDAILDALPEDVRELFERRVRRLPAYLTPPSLTRLIEKVSKRHGLPGRELTKAAVAALRKHEDSVPGWSPNQLRHAAATRIAN